MPGDFGFTATAVATVILPTEAETDEQAEATSKDEEEN